ncbi:hypothetical protein [Nocardiopsis xinjiangensis]|uniref:hypothetical protein n=1 Tax=Nocardiopsis xinjiangensis TaxID=124285 RepID=UPI0003478D64|nr:hypothetical protein [Nocardiopsis xinjiangensis]
MPKCIAAVFGSAQNLLHNLFRAPRGRHTTRQNTATRRFPGGRFSLSRIFAGRRSARRVRRYAPALPAQPVRVPAQTALFHERTRRDQRAATARPPTGRPSDQAPTAPERTTLAPSTDRFPADEVALVRPYFSAHERSLEHDRTPERNRARREGDRRQRIATDRLAGWGADTRALVTLPVPSPPVRGPRVPAARAPEAAAAPHACTARIPSRLDHLPHLSRLRRRQQQRRAQEVAV